LDGHNLVRLVYLDEGGVSAREPLVVVAGVVVNADRSLVAVESYLDVLIEKHIPPADRSAFIFHATELWSGSRYFKDDALWPLDRRLAILDDLVQIPRMFDIPVVYGLPGRTSYGLPLKRIGEA
jgi:hypothetical protein